jgi:hypothetical protein
MYIYYIYLYIYIYCVYQQGIISYKIHLNLFAAVFSWDGRMYAIGGNRGEVPNAEVYDPGSKKWTLLSWPQGLPYPQNDLHFFFAITTYG